MNDALLMGMLHRLTDAQEQLKPLPRRLKFLIAELRNRDAFDQFHHEVRTASAGRTGVQDLGDVRVVHERQGLPLLLEAGDDACRVHAGFDDLQGHAAFDRMFLLAHVDRAHATFAELLQQLVRPKHRAGPATQCPFPKRGWLAWPPKVFLGFRLTSGLAQG